MQKSDKTQQQAGEPIFGTSISRRDLLTGAAVAIGGVALGGSFVAPSTAQAQVVGDALTAAR
jgi:hypothetical protein